MCACVPKGRIYTAFLAKLAGLFPPLHLLPPPLRALECGRRTVYWGRHRGGRAAGCSGNFSEQSTKQRSTAKQSRRQGQGGPERAALVGAQRCAPTQRSS